MEPAGMLEAREEPTRLSMRIALLSGFDSDRQAILFGRQGTGGVGRVGARRVIQLVEIKRESSRLVDSVARQTGVEKASRLVGGGLAGGIAQDEEQLVAFPALKHRFQAHGFVVQGEFGD